MAMVKSPNASTESGPTLSKKNTTKDGGASSNKLKALVVAFNKKKGSMSPEQRKKVAARIKSLKQQAGQKGVLKGA